MSLSIRGFFRGLKIRLSLQPVGLPKLKTRPKCQGNDDFQGEVGEVSAIPKNRGWKKQISPQVLELGMKSRRASKMMERWRPSENFQKD